MIAVMITMLIVSVLAAAALAAASDDAQLTGNDLAQKQAYLAAKSGIADYELHLNQDPNYWTTCPTPSGSGSEPRAPVLCGVDVDCRHDRDGVHVRSREPGRDADREQQRVAAYGTFRIKSTGTALGGKVKRTVYATFQSRSFLDYVYYTKYETQDPSAYPSSDGNAPSQTCSTYYYNGRPLSNGTHDYCQSIWFNTGDTINGPMHSNDTLAICGSPSFGRATVSTSTRSRPARPRLATTSRATRCTDNADLQQSASNKLATGVATIDPPPTNDSSSKLRPTRSPVRPTSRSETPQHVRHERGLNSGAPTSSKPTVANTVSGYRARRAHAATTRRRHLHDGATAVVSRSGLTPGAAGCGTSRRRHYNNSLTIASDNDIVDRRQPAVHRRHNLLGLVAQNYVRVYHPCTGGTNQTNSVTQPNSMNNPTIDAAILSLTGSFMVDNYNCGATLGNLNVNGAIAQIYRGIVGIFAAASRRLLEELHVQRQPSFRGAAALPRADRGDLACGPRDRVQRHRLLAGGQGLGPLISGTKTRRPASGGRPPNEVAANLASRR